MFAIGTVERDTGIAWDTLRIWERRYGFPTPELNAKGERVYSTEQIHRLQRIRRLLDQVVAAVERSGVTMVALSFSACFARGSFRDDLQELVERLREGAAVCIGGAGLQRLWRLPPSVVKMSLDAL